MSVSCYKLKELLLKVEKRAFGADVIVLTVELEQNCQRIFSRIRTQEVNNFCSEKAMLDFKFQAKVLRRYPQN